MPPSRTFADCTWLSVGLVSLPWPSCSSLIFPLFYFFFPTFAPSLPQQPSLSPLHSILTYPFLLLPSLTNLNNASHSQIRFRCCQGHGKQDRTATAGKSGRYQACKRRQDLIPAVHSKKGIIQDSLLLYNVKERHGE